MCNTISSPMILRTRYSQFLGCGPPSVENGLVLPIFPNGTPIVARIYLRVLLYVGLKICVVTRILLSRFASASVGPLWLRLVVMKCALSRNPHRLVLSGRIPPLTGTLSVVFLLSIGFGCGRECFRSVSSMNDTSPAKSCVLPAIER